MEKGVDLSLNKSGSRVTPNGEKVKETPGTAEVFEFKEVQKDEHLQPWVEWGQEVAANGR